MSEPCPFCGERVEPIYERFGVKRCPRCGRRWRESGGGRGGRDTYPSNGGASAEAAAV